MKIKEIEGKIIKDSRKDKTIKAIVKTDYGLFAASSPSGKSRGKYERPMYKESIEEDITTLTNLSSIISEMDVNSFDDLAKIESEVKNKLGANTIYALELAILKALATEKGKSLWQLINKDAKKFPYPVGNCIGGGLHSKKIGGKKPDFQEFLFIPKAKNFADSVFILQKAHKIIGEELKLRKIRGPKNDENAWSTSLSNEEVLEVIMRVKEQLEEETGHDIDIGLDIAASTFFDGDNYVYKNAGKTLDKKEQIAHIKDIVDKYNLDYLEDPLEENDMKGFAELKKEVVRARPTCIVVGDDLTVSQLDRFSKAIKENSIGGIILKPNQVGSLLTISKIVKIAKEKGIKTILSHRSGETLEYSLADLAFGFQADYIKTGAVGKEREVKLSRLIEIEGALK